MAFVHGKNANISINAVDWSPYSDNISVPKDIDTSETSHFGTNAKTYIMGMEDSKVTVAGLWDATLDAAAQTILAGQANGTLLSVPVIYGPAGSTTGNVKYTFSAILTQWQVDAGTGDVVKFSATLQRTGATTTSVF